jgi:hypothetical protein
MEITRNGIETVVRAERVVYRGRIRHDRNPYGSSRLNASSVVGGEFGQ